MPDHREIYILAGGILAGILLGPQGLGRFAPHVYERWFRTVEQVQLESNKYRLELATGEQTMDLSLQEFRNRHEQMMAQLQSKSKQAYRSRARLSYVVLLLAAVFVVEVFAGRHTLLVRRLTRLRYMLLAVAIALILAQPSVLALTF